MFKFKLESVLSLREKMEDSKKRELGAAIMVADSINNDKNMLLRQKEMALQDARHQTSNIVSLHYLKDYYRYNMRMNKEIEEKQKQLDEANKKVEEKRQDLIEAIKKRKILDNLKAIEETQYKEEEKRIEQRVLDDLVTYKYGAKGKE